MQARKWKIRYQREGEKLSRSYTWTTVEPITKEQAEAQGERMCSKAERFLGVEPAET